MSPTTAEGAWTRDRGVRPAARCRCPGAVPRRLGRLSERCAGVRVRGGAGRRRGGASSGAIAALVSTFSFDFFFTHPYQSLKIDNADDVGTAVLLLLIGLLVAALVGFAHESRKRSERTVDDSDRVHRIAELAASGVPIAELTQAVETELTELLDSSNAATSPCPRRRCCPLSGATAPSTVVCGAGFSATCRCLLTEPRSASSGEVATSDASFSFPTGTSVSRSSNGAWRSPSRTSSAQRSSPTHPTPPRKLTHSES